MVDMRIRSHYVALEFSRYIFSQNGASNRRRYSSILEITTKLYLEAAPESDLYGSGIVAKLHSKGKSPRNLFPVPTLRGIFEQTAT